MQQRHRLPVTPEHTKPVSCKGVAVCHDQNDLPPQRCAAGKGRILTDSAQQRLHQRQDGQRRDQEPHTADHIDQPQRQPPLRVVPPLHEQQIGRRDSHTEQRSLCVAQKQHHPLHHEQHQLPALGDLPPCALQFEPRYLEQDANRKLRCLVVLGAQKSDKVVFSLFLGKDRPREEYTV